MAKFSKKNALSIKGIYNIEDGKIFIEVEDVDDPIDLANVSTEFQGKEITLTITLNTDLPSGRAIL